MRVRALFGELSVKSVVRSNIYIQRVYTLVRHPPSPHGHTCFLLLKISTRFFLHRTPYPCCCVLYDIHIIPLAGAEGFPQTGISRSHRGERTEGCGHHGGPGGDDIKYGEVDTFEEAGAGICQYGAGEAVDRGTNQDGVGGGGVGVD
jgi:hypothetical protein